MKKAFLCLLSTFAIMGCSEDQKTQQIFFNTTANTSKISSWKPLSLNASTSTIQILNSLNQPIANAKVLVGSAIGSPFKNNLFVTDKNGLIQNLNDWTTKEHITADAPGFVRQTLLSQKPGHITMKLSAAYLAHQMTITGQVTQLPVVNGDKNIDFGLVMAAIQRSDLLNFDLNSVISPISDMMKVATSTIPVPTNVSLPKQKESYILNLTIEKPEYRFFSPTSDTRKLFAAAGRFPFKPVVQELRAGKPFYEVINYFDLYGGGLRDVTPSAQITNLDIPGNELAFTQPISIASPQLNADEIFIALSVSEVSGFLIPTGIKKMAANTTTALNILDHQPAFTVNVLKKQTEFMAQTPGADRLSAALLPYVLNAKPNMLPLVNDPSVIDSKGYVITLPNISLNISLTNRVYPLAVSAVISDLQNSGTTDKPITELVRKWEVLGTQWPAKIELPNWPLDTLSKKRFEINYIGGMTSQNIDLGDDLIKATTHVTHSSTDF